MATKTLTPLDQRKAIKRTFLRDVTVKVTFAETDLLGNGNVLKSFLRDKFGISGDFNFPKLGGIDIVSDSRNEKYNFSTTSATLIMDSNVYRYFEDSLKPRLDIIISFLKTIGIKEVKCFSLMKRNLFQATAEDAFQAWKIALMEAFKSDNIHAIAASSSNPTKPFKISILETNEAKWGEIRVPFTVDVPDKNEFRFNLDLEAISKLVQVTELIERCTQMNNDIFESFTHIISDKLINLMQQD